MTCFFKSTICSASHVLMLIINRNVLHVYCSFPFLKQRMGIPQYQLGQHGVTLSLALQSNLLLFPATTGHQLSMQAFPLSVRHLQLQARGLALFLHQSHQFQLHVKYQHGPLLQLKPVHLLQ
uniref:Uncharacterized protein n=2 Tax=Oryza TaxID=4527 RepID=A0A0D3EVJ6_9ORYZ